jgi:hypothetical protein
LELPRNSEYSSTTSPLLMHFRTCDRNNISGIGTSDTTCASNWYHKGWWTSAARINLNGKYMQTIYAQIFSQNWKDTTGYSCMKTIKQYLLAHLRMLFKAPSNRPITTQKIIFVNKQ